MKHLATRISILVLFASVMLPSGLTKLTGGPTPDWFLKQFSGSLIDIFDGSLPIQFFAIAVTETALGLLALGALALSALGRDIQFAMSTLLISSSLLFTGLGFGQRITMKFPDAASLFMYAVLSLLLLKVSETLEEKK